MLAIWELGEDIFYDGLEARKTGQCQATISKTQLFYLSLGKIVTSPISQLVLSTSNVKMIVYCSLKRN